MRVLSLGAGVQSSTLLLMACAGEIEIDHAIFGDTGWEPAEVYGWFADVLEPAASAAGIPLHVVRSRQGDITEHWWEMPVFLVDPVTGSRGMARRQCTNRYKKAPVRRKIRELLGVGPRSPIPAGAVDCVLGISWDESERMADSDVAFVRHEYPLVDRRMTRADCQAWLGRAGYDRAPRSACIGCPYHSDAAWADLKHNRPEQFAQAVAVDEAMRAPGRSGSLRGAAYLHAKRIPLAEVVFASDDDTARGDCAGFCAT